MSDESPEDAPEPARPRRRIVTTRSRPAPGVAPPSPTPHDEAALAVAAPHAAAEGIRWFAICLAIGLLFAAAGLVDSPVFHLIGMLGPIGATLAYPVIGMSLGLHRRPSLAEKFADNCYYLGFIFTQASLLFAFTPITVFNRDVSSADVLRFFGVAIGASMVGLVARTWFTQTLATTPEVADSLQSEVQDLARHVSEQARSILEQFDTLLTSVSALPTKMDERLEARVDGVGAALRTLDASIHDGVQDFAAGRDRVRDEIAAVSAHIVEQNALLTRRTGEAGAAIAGIAAALEKACSDNIDALSVMTRGVESSAAALASFSNVQTEIGAFGAQAERIARIGDRVQEAADTLHDRFAAEGDTAARRIAEAVDDAATRFQQGTGSAVTQFDAASRQTLDEIGNRARLFSGEMQQSIDAFGAAVQAFRQELARLREQ